jgi:intracellular sulfur oxidation DsrE/DsrF family protein
MENNGKKNIVIVEGIMTKRKASVVLSIVASITVLALVGFSYPQGKKHRIIFEVNVSGQDQWAVVLNNLENVQKAFVSDGTEIEVVVHGKGLGLLLAANTQMQDRLKQLADNGVTFAACENTMRRMSVRKEDLLPFAKTVDSGVAEVVRKQEAGWSYIKSGF